jgi:cell division protein FtsA
VPDEALIEVPSVGGRQSRPLKKLDMVNIIQPRGEEIFQLINREIKRSGYEDLVAAGVVLTGGSAALPGMVELGEEILDLPVRVGMPQGVSELTDVVSNPKYATAVGLVLYGFEKEAGQSGEEKPQRFAAGDNLFRAVMKRMTGWYDEFF